LIIYIKTGGLKCGIVHLFISDDAPEGEDMLMAIGWHLCGVRGDDIAVTGHS